MSGPGSVPSKLTKEDLTEVLPAPAYILSYDASTFFVQDYFHFKTPPPLVVMKSVLVNTLESYSNAYAESLMQLVRASEECAKRVRSGPAIIDGNGAMGLLGKVQHRLEQFYARLNEWDGKTEISILMPFSEIAMQENELIGQPQIVDTSKSRPYVNGIYFSARRE